jgi:competence protein ComEA
VGGGAPQAETGGAGFAASGPSIPDRLVVHVSGLVAVPGVYELPEHGRVADAIRAAGGLLAGARPDGLNLARPLTDGEQLHVPGPHEPGAPPPGPAPAGGSGTQAGAGAQAGAGQAGDAWLPDGRLDVNRATQADFEELPGIGPVLAERLVAHRDEVGRFENVGDLLAVRGIGEKTLAALADLITT